MITTSFQEAGIKFPGRYKKEGTTKTLCPRCSHTRKKSDEPCLWINFNQKNGHDQIGHLYKCFNCSFSGGVYEDGLPTIDRYEIKPKIEYVKPRVTLDDFDLDSSTIKWFKARGIEKQTLLDFGIKSAEYKFRKDKPSEDAIMFPFFKNGELINIQYRNLGDAENKDYKSVRGAELIFYGYDHLVKDGVLDFKKVVVVEGPVDALTVYQSGYPVLSVPNGSSFGDEKQTITKVPRLRYLDDPDIQFVFKNVEEVILFGDDDTAGRRLMDELATRIGPEKCFKVRHPEGAKDANDVLRKYGAQKVVEVIESAQRMPVQGVVTVSQIRDQVLSLYESGPDTGLTSGWNNLDKVVRVGQGRVIVITGVPESGKTRFNINWIMELAKRHDIQASIFTPESRPYSNFLSKMVQINTGKRFGKPGEEDRITKDELVKSLDWIDKHFTFNTPVTRTVKEITDTWKHQLQSTGVRYGVLDPFNYIIRPDNINETSFVLQSLTYLTDWAVTNNFTVFVIVHPRQHPFNEKTGEYPVVTPYQLYGSSHWFNASDTILSIWRSMSDPEQPVHLFVLKQKQEELGTSNHSVRFDYDVSIGIYVPRDTFIYSGGTKNPPRNRRVDVEEDAEYTDQDSDLNPWGEDDFDSEPRRLN